MLNNYKRRLWNKTGGNCGICGLHVPLKELTLDHIVPLAKGGTDTWDNHQPAHRSCNEIKKDLPQEEARELINRKRMLRKMQKTHSYASS